MPRDLRAFVKAALGEIALSEPEADRALRAALGDLSAKLRHGDERFVLQPGHDGWRFLGEGASADVCVAFDDAVVLDLIDGALTLNDAIFNERVVVVGPIDKICRFYDAVLIFLEGMLRASGAPALLEQFRNA